MRKNLAEHRNTVRRQEDGTAIALAFHSLIVESSRNRYLSVIIELVGQTLDRLPDPPGTSPVAQERVLRDHEQLVDALEQRDAEKVRQLAAVHLQHIWRRDAGADDVPGPPITAGGPTTVLTSRCACAPARAAAARVTATSRELAVSKLTH